jgi:hypothetical protein
MTTQESQIPTEVIELPRPTTAQVEVISADPRMEVRVVLPGTFTLLGYVPVEGEFEAYVAMNVDGNFITVKLDQAMSKEEIFTAFAEALPSGFEAATNGTQSEVLILSILRARQRTSMTPHVMFFATDPAQRYLWRARNKICIDGDAAHSSVVASTLQLTVDGHPVKIALLGGENPFETASRIRDALPPGYRALIELPVFGESTVDLTILRRQTATA